MNSVLDHHGILVLVVTFLNPVRIIFRSHSIILMTDYAIGMKNALICEHYVSDKIATLKIRNENSISILGPKSRGKSLCTSVALNGFKSCFLSIL